MIKTISRNIDIKIYVHSLKVLEEQDYVSTAKKIAEFNAKLVLNGELRFDRCEIIFISENGSGWYRYVFEIKDGKLYEK